MRLSETAIDLVYLKFNCCGTRFIRFFAAMALEVCSINSGSNGNCYYLGNNQEAVLVDVGISCREVENRMQHLGLSMQKVKAIFVSHEHSDHIRGIPRLSKKYNLPVYITPATKRGGRLLLHGQQVFPFNAHHPVQIGSIAVTGFPKFHDASDPYSFIVECSGVRVGVFTDLGKCCEQLIRYFQQCHAAILESNYDTAMLESGSYPYYLKRRIRGGLGHLSNDEALSLFKNYRPAHMSHLILAHLSKENNCPKLVHELFLGCAGNTHITVASRDRATEILKIGKIAPAQRHIQQLELLFS